MKRLKTAALISIVGFANHAYATDNCVRVVGAEWNPETITSDPSNQINVPNMQLARMIYDPFIDLDADLRPIPALAESWTSNADGTEWIFNVRQGVKFHDGSALTAADVVFTYRRLLDPTLKSPAAANLATLRPENFEATDEKTLKVRLNSPQFELPIILATNFAMVIKADSTSDKIHSTPNGTGPFTMPNFASGSSKYKLAKNYAYWKGGLPLSDCIELSAITESVTRMVSLVSGDADVATIVDPTTAETMREDPKIALSVSKSGTAITMGMFTDSPPFDDLRVRKALKLVIDRDEMVKTALLGFGFSGNDNPIPPTSPDSYRTTIIPRDITKAKSLLADAGYRDGITVDLHIADAYPGTMAMGQIYQQMASEAGVKINLVVVPASEYWDNIWLSKPFSVSNWGARPTASALSVAYRKDSKWNETHWFRDDYEALLDKAAATADADERKQVYREAQELLSNEGGVIIPIFSTAISAQRVGCIGYDTPSDHNRPDFSKIVCN